MAFLFNDAHETAVLGLNSLLDEETRRHLEAARAAVWTIFSTIKQETGEVATSDDWDKELDVLPPTTPDIYDPEIPNFCFHGGPGGIAEVCRILRDTKDPILVGHVFTIKLTPRLFNYIHMDKFVLFRIHTYSGPATRNKAIRPLYAVMRALSFYYNVGSDIGARAFWEQVVTALLARSPDLPTQSELDKSTQSSLARISIDGLLLGGYHRIAKEVPLPGARSIFLYVTKLSLKEATLAISTGGYVPTTRVMALWAPDPGPYIVATDPARGKTPCFYVWAPSGYSGLYESGPDAVSFLSATLQFTHMKLRLHCYSLMKTETGIDSAVLHDLGIIKAMWAAVLAQPIVSYYGPVVNQAVAAGRGGLYVCDATVTGGASHIWRPIDDIDEENATIIDNSIVETDPLAELRLLEQLEEMRLNY